MRQVHRAGEKAFVDYSGQRPYLVDPKTGECTAVELFVMALGASNLPYAEAPMTQRGPDFVASHVRAFDYFGGATHAVGIDQPPSRARSPFRYEPAIQRTYEAMAVHYDTTVLPARPKHPPLCQRRVRHKLQNNNSGARTEPPDEQTPRHRFQRDRTQAQAAKIHRRIQTQDRRRRGRVSRTRRSRRTAAPRRPVLVPIDHLEGAGTNEYAGGHGTQAGTE